MNIIKKNPKKWRIRELIAGQIGKLTKIYNPETIFKIISPISFKLCNDTVYIVRKKAAKNIHKILLTFSDNNEMSALYKECVIENIKGFSNSTRYNQRQTYIIFINPKTFF